MSGNEREAAPQPRDWTFQITLLWVAAVLGSFGAPLATFIVQYATGPVVDVRPAIQLTVHQYPSVRDSAVSVAYSVDVPSGDTINEIRLAAPVAGSAIVPQADEIQFMLVIRNAGGRSAPTVRLGFKVRENLQPKFYKTPNLLLGVAEPVDSSLPRGTREVTIKDLSPGVTGVIMFRYPAQRYDPADLHLTFVDHGEARSSPLKHVSSPEATTLFRINGGDPEATTISHGLGAFQITPSQRRDAPSTILLWVLLGSSLLTIVVASLIVAAARTRSISLGAFLGAANAEIDAGLARSRRRRESLLPIEVLCWVLALGLLGFVLGMRSLLRNEAVWSSIPDAATWLGIVAVGIFTAEIVTWHRRARIHMLHPDAKSYVTGMSAVAVTQRVIALLWLLLLSWSLASDRFSYNPVLGIGVLATAASLGIAFVRRLRAIAPYLILSSWLILASAAAWSGYWGIKFVQQQASTFELSVKPHP